MEETRNKDIESLFNRSELRRLEKAAKEKDKRHLAEWAGQFESTINQKYEKYYKDQLTDMVDVMLLTIVYTLHYNESTKFGNTRIKSFVDDLVATVDNFNTGAYDIEDYKKQLAEDGIKVISRKGE